MKIVKKVLLIIITTLLVLMVAFNLYNFFSMKVLKHKLTTIGGYSVLEVVSGSMEPTIHIGDMIIINTKESNYKENDIVTFTDVNGSFVTHRIISINEEEMITKGDFNNTEDEPTKIEKIVGKYVFRIPGAGKIISSFKTPFTLVMILIIGLLFCYLISTDKNGNPILTDEEKEFWEEQKKPKVKKKKNKKKENRKKEKIRKEQESIEKEIESLFREKREINKQIRILLEKKSKFEKPKSNYNKSKNNYDKKKNNYSNNKNYHYNKKRNTFHNKNKKRK